MKIPLFILSAAVGAILTLEGWTLITLINQGQDIAAIKATLAVHKLAVR